MEEMLSGVLLLMRNELAGVEVCGNTVLPTVTGRRCGVQLVRCRTHHQPSLWTLHHSSYGLRQRGEERHGGDIQSIFLLFIILLPLVFALLQDPFKEPVDDGRIDGLVHVHLSVLDLLLFLSAAFTLVVFNNHHPRTRC